MKLRAALSSRAAVLLCTATASAALTSSEKAQVRDFVAAARPADAARVRSLVARTDLSAKESVEVLRAAVAPTPFTPQRGAFLRELVFGPASQASRPLLAEAVVDALVARADVIYRRYVGGLDHEPAAIGELVAIYGFLDHDLANAGKPTAAAHDPNAGIPKAAYAACAKALADHVEREARWLKGDVEIPASVAPVRAQAQIALFDMQPDGVTRRVDAADRLGLAGPQRKMLTEWGLLFEDAGKLGDAGDEKVRKVLEALPGARADVEVVYAGATKQPLRARGLVVHAPARGKASYPFPSEVSEGAWDAAVAPIAHDLAVVAALRALANRGELRVQAERDAAAAQAERRPFGQPGAPSVHHVVGAAAHLLLVDAPRAVDLAFVRYVAGHPESAALLSDAIGALAAFAPPGSAGPRVEVGAGAGTTTLTNVRLAPNGVATSFTLGGHTWTIDRRAPSYAVASVERDGKPVSLKDLATAKAPMSASGPWTEGGVTFAKLHGSPRAGLAPGAGKDGPTVTLTGVGASGYDAIAATSPGEDLHVEGDLDVRGGPGGVAVRAASGRRAVTGAMLVVTPGGRTALLTRDDAGHEALLAAPIEPSPKTPVHVSISVKGTKIEAKVGGAVLQGTLPGSMKRGDVALVAKRGATVQLGKLVLKKD